MSCIILLTVVTKDVLQNCNCDRLLSIYLSSVTSNYPSRLNYWGSTALCKACLHLREQTIPSQWGRGPSPGQGCDVFLWQLLHWLQVVTQTGLHGTPLTNPLPSLEALSAGGGDGTVHRHCSAQSCSYALSCSQNQPRTMHITGVLQRSWVELLFLGGKWR